MVQKIFSMQVSLEYEQQAMKKGSCISAGPCGTSGSKASAHSGSFWGAANYPESLVMLSFPFLLLPFSRPSQLLCGAAGPQLWAGTLLLPPISRHSVASRQWIILHPLAPVPENTTWAGASRREVSCPSQAHWVVLSSCQEICFPSSPLFLVPISKFTLMAAPEPSPSLQAVTWLFCPFASGFGEF